MSVLIKGMEMPKMPDSIGQGEKIPYIDVRIFADGDAVITKGTRPYYDKYAAVELPPHGRLIDADAAKEILKPIDSICCYEPEWTWGELYESNCVAIDKLPTIIPAEGGTE